MPRLPLRVRVAIDPRISSLLAQELENHAPDVLHASGAVMAPYLPIVGSFHRHLDFIDALSVRLDHEAAAAGWPKRVLLTEEARRMCDFERLATTRADTYSLVSQVDKAEALHLRGAAIIPNGVSASEFPYRDPADRPQQLLFFGNLSYGPNQQAAEHVVRKVLPLVTRAVPSAGLRLSGAEPTAKIRRLRGFPGVVLVGPVDRMVEELHSAAVAVVPMFLGSGIKNKVLEAFSAGTPVVTNSMGIAGVTGAEENVHYLRAEAPEQLAAACVKLLDDALLRSQLAVAARTLVEESFDWDAKARMLLALYRSKGRPRNTL